MWLSFPLWNKNTYTFSPPLPKQWCSNTFKNVNVVPPDVGAVHQVNLEHLSRVVQVTDGFIYPDTVVGTDSHTTMVNGLGILGWGETLDHPVLLVFLLLGRFSPVFCAPPGVGGIESEAVMLGQPVSLALPQVVGCKLVGSINPLTTSIDIVLGITKVTSEKSKQRQQRLPSHWLFLGCPSLSSLTCGCFHFPALKTSGHCREVRGVFWARRPPAVGPRSDHHRQHVPGVQRHRQLLSRRPSHTQAL